MRFIKNNSFLGFLIILVAIITIFLVPIIIKELYHFYPQLLEKIITWYLIGLLCRYLLLDYRREIDDPVYGTDWSAIYRSFLVAILGPFVFIQIVRQYLRNKI